MDVGEPHRLTVLAEQSSRDLAIARLFFVAITAAAAVGAGSAQAAIADHRPDASRSGGTAESPASRWRRHFASWAGWPAVLVLAIVCALVVAPDSLELPRFRVSGSNVPAGSGRLAPVQRPGRVAMKDMPRFENVPSGVHTVCIQPLTKDTKDTSNERVACRLVHVEIGHAQEVSLRLPPAS